MDWAQVVVQKCWFEWRSQKGEKVQAAQVSNERRYSDAGSAGKHDKMTNHKTQGKIHGGQSGDRRGQLETIKG